FPEASWLRERLLGTEGLAADPVFRRAPSDVVAGVLGSYARGAGETGGREPYDPLVAEERAAGLGRELVGALDPKQVDGESEAPAVLALELSAVGPEWLEGVSVLRAIL